jgi:hypothetical protein
MAFRRPLVNNRLVVMDGHWRVLAGLVALGAVVLAAGLIATAASPGPRHAPASLAGCNVFPPFVGGPQARETGSESAWNQDVSHASTARSSARYIARIGRLGGNQSIRPGLGGDGLYGIPYTVVGAGRAKVRVKGSHWAHGFRRGPIPPHARVENGSDRHLVVIQRGTCRLFELFDARYMGGPRHRWHAAATARFNLRSRKRHHPGSASADAAGLPILPGLVRYNEVKRGQVRHALRVVFSATRRGYIHPATRDASPYCDRYLPPMGLRMRLSHGYFEHNLHRFPPSSQARVIFTALYHYGIIVADNGGAGNNWTIFGANSKRWNDADLQQLTTVPGRAFVVVKSGKVHSPC